MWFGCFISLYFAFMLLSSASICFNLLHLQFEAKKKEVAGAIAGVSVTSLPPFTSLPPPPPLPFPLPPLRTLPSILYLTSSFSFALFSLLLLLLLLLLFFLSPNLPYSSSLYLFFYFLLLLLSSIFSLPPPPSLPFPYVCVINKYLLT